MGTSRTKNLSAYVRFVRALPGHFRTRMTLEQAQSIIRMRLAEREDRFLDLVERRILGNPQSPYHALLKLAGCELGDLRDMVRQEGVEGALLKLRKEGVYLTFEELKGRQPIVRDGRVIEAGTHAFDNPFLSEFFEAETGGSTGTPTKVPISQHYLIDTAPVAMVYLHAHGLLGTPSAMWRHIMPSSDGMSEMISAAYFGSVPQEWFWPGTVRSLGSSAYNRLSTYGIILALRILGVPAPWPRLVPLKQALTVARWAVGAVRRHGRCLVSTFPSMALRVSVAAQEHGLDLSGVTFRGGGEPPTEAKVAGIKRSGAEWIPHYATTEIGLVGLGCAQPADGNDVHLLTSDLAVIQHPRPLPGSGVSVGAFYFTTLLATTPTLLLNAESDDFGLIEERHCGCPLETLGLTKHVRHIRSFAKLTAEGMGVAGEHMIYILGKVLPARFGGTALDYQLVEEEDADGFTRMDLRVSPRVQIENDSAVLEVVWQTLADLRAATGAAHWERAGALRIKRAEPIVTARGKLLPLVRHRITDTGVVERREGDQE